VNILKRVQGIMHNNIMSLDLWMLFFRRIDFAIKKFSDSSYCHVVSTSTINVDFRIRIFIIVH
jgi:hypothetical protein